MHSLKKNIFLVMSVAVLLVAVGCKNNSSVPVPSNVYYTCSMDPQVMEKKPGTCPICKMDLVRVEIDPEQKSGEIKLSDAQIRLANIQTDTLRSHLLGDEITLAATLKENQNGINLVTSKIAGRIERLYVRNEGEQIRKGAAVFDLYSEELASTQQDYLLALESQKRYSGNDFSFSRIAEAAKNKLMLWGLTEKQIIEIEKSGEAKNVVTYYSKYSGFVTEMNVSEGDYVDEGSVVLSLADLSTVWVEAQLYVTDLGLLNQTQEALIDIPYFPGQLLKGKISFVNPGLEGSSKIILVRVEIKNPDGEYQPGMQAWITLKGKGRNVMAVPTNALIQGAEGNTLWLRNIEGNFESRMVSIGKSNKDYTEILSGVKSGEIVVISGAYLLNSEFIFKKGADPMAGHDM